MRFTIEYGKVPPEVTVPETLERYAKVHNLELVITVCPPSQKIYVADLRHCSLLKGQTIAESMCGFGDTIDEAIKDMVKRMNGRHIVDVISGIFTRLPIINFLPEEVA